MSEWFNFFDKNNDKKLDKDELRRVFHAMCWTVTDKEMDEIFKAADTDSKGNYISNVKSIFNSRAGCLVQKGCSYLAKNGE